MLYSCLFRILSLANTCVSLTFPDSTPSDRGAIAGSVDLRILPFGDSIAWGQSSSDGNGWRLALYDKLIGRNNVEYVGKLKHGSMQNNENEGHQGYDIELIREKGMPDFSRRPNVILLMLGTNNIVRDIHYDQAPRLLSDLIDVTLSACPDAVVLVATIPPLRNPEFEAKRVVYNDQLPGVVKAFADEKKHVALVGMDGMTQEHVNNWDKVHPTDAGYKIIGEKWYEAIVAAGSRGWISSPLPTGTPSDAPISKQDQKPDQQNQKSESTLSSVTQIRDSSSYAIHFALYITVLIAIVAVIRKRTSLRYWRQRIGIL